MVYLWDHTEPAGRTPFIEEAIGLIDGSLHRVWHPNHRMMEYQQPVGYWSTEKRAK